MGSPRPLRSSAELAAAGIAVVVVLAIAGLWRYTSVDFAPYFARLNPIAASIAICVLGVMALAFLQARYAIRIVDTQLPARYRVAAALAAVPFMVSVTWADLTLRFPPDINVDLPLALAFYPAMGLIAQLALHVVPFALSLWILSRLRPSWPLKIRVWAAIVPVACLEAAFQAFVPASGDLQALRAFVTAQLFFFGLVELYVYWRFDFLNTIVFRLSYYAYWHVLWAAARA